MKQKSNYTNLIIDGDSIEITVEGVTVRGKIILRDKKNIAVEITSPYAGISESSGGIPLLGLQVHNFLGKAGDEKAASLLCALYRFCHYAEEHKERLLVALQEYKFKIAYTKHFSPEARELAQCRTTALENFLAIRKELKSGMIDKIEYHRRIGHLNKDLKLLTEEIDIDLDAIFDECFNNFWNTPVWALKRETVLAYLDNISKREMTVL
jgi:hypothetical protein